MVREFSEEKRQEIFRMLDEIDQREWKSFMEWCGSRAEEFGDWPDKLAVSAYTRYVDEYHEKVLEINEMTRQQVNTVFENVAEIDARYAARMRECQEKIKGQIAIVRTMTEFMDSMADGKPNMALITEGSINKIDGREDVPKPQTVLAINCYKIGEKLSLADYGIENCMTAIEKLRSKGFVSKNDYHNLCYWAEVINHVPSAEADKIRNMMQECLDHVVTTVYIYNCLQVLCGVYQTRTFTPEECCKANEIFRYFGITDRNDIADFLVCCAGESGGFQHTLEVYKEGRKYKKAERGAGYIQVTWKTNQQRCLEEIYNIYNIDEVIDGSKDGYAEELAEYPWEASAWYWAVYPTVGINDKQPLNSYVMERLEDTNGKLTLGIVLTSESFVHGDVSSDNEDRGCTMNDALSLIVRHNCLRGDNNRAWYIEGSGEECFLRIPVEMINYFRDEDGEIDLDIAPPDPLPEEWEDPDAVRHELKAPHNWENFERCYSALQGETLLDFDLHTELP